MKVKGKVYRTCVQRVMVYGSETWPMKVEDVQRLERTERMMVRWMCGARLKNRISSEELNGQARYCEDYGDRETGSTQVVWSS